MSIPVSVIVVTKNEEKNIADCLSALANFSEVIVCDSKSRDKTAEIARLHGANVIDFTWNGAYPKKRQHCLDFLALKHDWVMFVDADEIVTDALIDELEALFVHEPSCAGYFIKGYHSLNGRILKYGLQNNKLALFNKNKIHFPEIDDLDIPGMGEIEGHYQPVLKEEFANQKIGQLKSPLHHSAMEDARAWIFRHQKYARWEIGMNQKNAWPKDPKPFRNRVKNFLRRNKYRPQIIFFISYILLLGFLDGRQGFEFARRKKTYYALIN